MKKLKSHINILLKVLTVLGLFISIFHYHSETLKCLNHPDGVHYSQDVDICTICLNTARNDFLPEDLAEVDLVVVDVIIITNSFDLENGYSYKLTGRSPPFMV